VYVGVVQALPPKAVPASVTNNPGYAFQLSGTNRTLKKLVVFRGQFIPALPATVISGRKNAAAASAASGKISGQISVGGDEFPMTAIPIP
jgi:hypothetical protein